MLTQTTLSVGDDRIKAEQQGWNTDAEMAFLVNKYTQTAHTCIACSLSSGCAHSPGSWGFSPGAFLLEATGAVSYRQVFIPFSFFSF